MGSRHRPRGGPAGAAILTFIDTILGHRVVSATDRKCAAVALTLQFIPGVPTGDWFSDRTDIRRTTRALASRDAAAKAGEVPQLTATAIFRVLQRPGSCRDPAFAEEPRDDEATEFSESVESPSVSFSLG